MIKQVFDGIGYIGGFSGGVSPLTGILVILGILAVFGIIFYIGNKFLK